MKPDYDQHFSEIIKQKDYWQHLQQEGVKLIAEKDKQIDKLEQDIKKKNDYVYECVQMVDKGQFKLNE